MIRLTILFLIIGASLYGQDSTFVRETCKKINEIQKGDIEGQINVVLEQSLAYIPAMFNTRTKDKRVQDFYKYQYILNRELKKTCPGFLLGQQPIKTQRVLDFEDRFSKYEIDSLKVLLTSIGTDKNIYIFLVTIDDYYPDSSIEEFASRIRDPWGNGDNFEKGSVLIAISTSKRQMRISTGEKSMKYLTDEECADVIKVMTSYFKTGAYFKGVAEGLSNLRRAI